jgi:hypothetical protein
MKNVGWMKVKKCVLFIFGLLVLASCNSDRDSKKESEKRINPNEILVDVQMHDSLYRLYDSVSKLWHRSRRELTRLDQMANTKAAYSGDFEMEYESSMQYVFQLATELKGLDSICASVGIYTFNYTIYKTPEAALNTIDSVLKNSASRLTSSQKKDIHKDRKRILRVKDKLFKIER